MPVIHSNIFNTATDGLDFNADSQTFTIAPGFTVASEQEDGVFSSNFQSTLVNFGLVESDTQIGVFMTGENAVVQNETGGAIVGLKGIVMDGANAHVVNAGSITGFGGSGVSFNLSSTEADLHNSGTIFGDGDAVHIESTTTGASINNSGRIESGDAGIFVGLGTGFTAVIVNSGTIEGDRHSVEGNSGMVDLTNSGTLDGDVVLGGGADVVRNLGTVIGDVDLGNGADIFDGRGGLVSGAVLGGVGADTLIGGAEDDLLSGGKSDDTLNGRGGDDVLTGGTGQDIMRGGAGSDTFVFLAAAESAPATLDSIMDFSHAEHDIIDLGALPSTLHFIGTAAFSGSPILGEVRYTDGGGSKGFRVDVDLNADKISDMSFIVHSADGPPVAGDFIL